MVADSKLIDCLREFLRTSDLTTVTVATVHRKLEEGFGVDLSDRKKFIQQQVALFLFENAGDSEEGDAEAASAVAAIKSEKTHDCSEPKGKDIEEEKEIEVAITGELTAGKQSMKQNEVKKMESRYYQLCNLSPQIQKIVGVAKFDKCLAVCKVWKYIKENKLLDQKNRPFIICEDTLRTIFGVDSINMLEVNQALLKHMWPVCPHKDPAKPTQKEKEGKRKREKDDPELKEKLQKGSISIYHCPVPLSDALVKFLGAGERALLRREAG